MKSLLLFLVLLSGCGVTVEPDPITYGQCEQHVRHLTVNVNGCWRITSRQGYMEAGQYMCTSKPTCEMIPGDTPLDYVSGDIAWVGDVRCDNSCDP
jgi:hypothetical protein